VSSYLSGSAQFICRQRFAAGKLRGYILSVDCVFSVLKEAAIHVFHRTKAQGKFLDFFGRF
jgi:hypothetical protein